MTTLSRAVTDKSKDGKLVCHRGNAHGYFYSTWPVLTEGETVKIESDFEGHCVTGVVSAIRDADTFELSSATLETLPMPQVEEGRPYVLPNICGHAHFRTWRKGDIVRLHGQFYKVASEKDSNSGMTTQFKLVPSTDTAYQSRPGRKHMTDSDPSDAQRIIGTCIRVGDEWLFVQDVEVNVTIAAGLSGERLTAVGKFVSVETAAKINAKKHKLVEVTIA